MPAGLPRAIAQIGGNQTGDVDAQESAAELGEPQISGDLPLHAAHLSAARLGVYPTWGDAPTSEIEDRGGERSFPRRGQRGAFGSQVLWLATEHQ